MNSRSRRAGSIRNGVLCGCLMVALTGALTARAQDLDSTRIYVVIPESERPLGFGLDSGQTTTTYPCLDSLNRAWDFLDIYKPFNHRGNILDGIYTVVFSDSMNLDTVEAAFRASGCLNDAYRMAVFQLYSTPNDSLFSHVADTTVRQWGLDGAHTRAQQAWDITTGDSQIVVAVIDEGIFWEHPDLIHNMWINEAEDINHNGTFDMWASTKDSNGVYGDSNGVDEDSNGYTDDVIGIKCLANGQYSPDVRQYQSWPINVGRPLAHGTNVAGFVAARTNNVEGGAGMAGGWGALPGVRIMVVTMEVQSSVFPDVAVQNAVEYATNAGADIISMS